MKSVEIIYRYGEQGDLARPRPVDSTAARHRLDQGSQAFAALIGSLSDESRRVSQVIEVDSQDLGLGSGDTARPAQRPFAAVLGCSDARVPIELVFNVGPNDLFVVRVAGNGLGAEGMGSLKYAIDHLGESLKLIVVLGHSACGAVKAAVDVFLNPKSYLDLARNHALRNILDRLLVVVHAAARSMAALHGVDVVHRARY